MENDSFNQPNGSPDRAVPAIAKAIRLLEAVALSRSIPGVSDLSRRTGLGKSTVHGLLTALSAEGLLSPSAGSKGYVLGPRLIELGLLARDRTLADLAEAALARITAATGETALFGRLEGDQVRILSRHESSHPLRISAPVGSAVPVLAGALGLAYLASMVPDEAARFVAGHGPPRFTGRSHSDTATYLAAVAEVRNRGCAVERGEYLPGILAAAASFTWLDDTYFVWVVALDAARGDDELDALAQAVAADARDLQTRLVQWAAMTSRRSA